MDSKTWTLTKRNAATSYEATLDFHGPRSEALGADVAAVWVVLWSVDQEVVLQAVSSDGEDTTIDVIKLSKRSWTPERVTAAVFTLIRHNGLEGDHDTVEALVKEAM